MNPRPLLFQLPHEPYSVREEPARARWLAALIAGLTLAYELSRPPVPGSRRA